MAEMQKRAAERHRCWLKALFVFNEGRSTLDAVVRNVSENGALLECEDMRMLPKEFYLVITKATGEQLRHRAQQVWRHEGALGVKFIEDTSGAKRSHSSMSHAD